MADRARDGHGSGSPFRQTAKKALAHRVSPWRKVLVPVGRVLFTRATGLFRLKKWEAIPLHVVSLGSPFALPSVWQGFIYPFNGERIFSSCFLLLRASSSCKSA